jgi:hypothetical protein
MESWSFHGSVVEDYIPVGYNFAKIGDRVLAFQRTYYFNMSDLIFHLPMIPKHISFIVTGLDDLHP